MIFRLLQSEIPKLLFIILIPAVLSCNAPRTNPLDPLNPDYDYGTLEGIVQSIGVPSVGIPDVTVIWQNANLITKTDANGRFRLINIPIKDGNLIFSKTGYKSDTLEVIWGTSKRFLTQSALNRLPVLFSISFYTVVINEPSSRRDELFVKAGILDHDDDVDSVIIYNPDLGLRSNLLYNSQEGNYQLSLSQQDLNVTDIEQTIGMDFYILTKDRFDNEFNIGTVRVTRVIKDAVTGFEPDSGEIVSQPFVFSWDKFNAGYNFTYTVEIYRAGISNQIVHSKTGIPSDSVSYSMTGSLVSGNYYWVIWVIDEFYNRSRSRPAAFIIQ